MVSRFVFLLRTLVPALALIVFLCGGFTPPAAQARVIGKVFEDRLEGDPGDGVLKTGGDIDDSGSSSGSDLTFDDSFSFSLTTVCRLPVYLPGTIPGYGAVVLMPADWSFLNSVFRQAERGGYHAP